MVEWTLLYSKAKANFQLLSTSLIFLLKFPNRGQRPYTSSLFVFELQAKLALERGKILGNV